MSKTLSIALGCLLLGVPLTACSDANQRTESNLIHHKQKKITLLEKAAPLKKSTESKGMYSNKLEMATKLQLRKKRLNLQKVERAHH